MAIETSMKSSAFGFLLAKLHLGQYDARVPSAVSVVWMALTGSFTLLFNLLLCPPPRPPPRCSNCSSSSSAGQGCCTAR